MTFEAIDFPALYETLETDAERCTNRVTESTLAKRQKFLASLLKFCSSVDTREYSANIFCILLHINGGGHIPVCLCFLQKMGSMLVLE